MYKLVLGKGKNFPSKAYIIMPKSTNQHVRKGLPYQGGKEADSRNFHSHTFYAPFYDELQLYYMSLN